MPIGGDTASKSVRRRWGAHMSWRILIERGNLEFSAAHFITFSGKCEPLHGHNYGVRVEAEGALTTDSYVFDFVVLKDIEVEHVAIGRDRKSTRLNSSH